MIKKIAGNKKIRSCLVVLAILIVVGGVAGTTVSVLKAQTKTVENKFTVGKVTTEIEEDIDTTTGTKAPHVNNTGSCACIVRMRATISPSDAKVEINIDESESSDWVLGTDGYYYYQKIVEAGDHTTDLFTTYKWTGAEDYSDFEEFDITLYQEAIQIEAVAENGTTISFQNGVYDQEIADQLWSIYEQ